MVTNQRGWPYLRYLLFTANLTLCIITLTCILDFLVSLQQNKFGKILKATGT